MDTDNFNRPPIVYADEVADEYEAAVGRRRRRPHRRVRLDITSVRLAACQECGELAEWTYAGGEESVCSDCLPRGCSCRAVGDADRAAIRSAFLYARDAGGRRLLFATGFDPAREFECDDGGRPRPCADWNFWPAGIPPGFTGRRG